MVVSVNAKVEFVLVLHFAVLRAVGLDHPVASGAARRDVFNGGGCGNAADQAGHAGCVEVVDGRREA